MSDRGWYSVDRTIPASTYGVEGTGRNPRSQGKARLSLGQEKKKKKKKEWNLEAESSLSLQTVGGERAKGEWKTNE